MYILYINDGKRNETIRSLESSFRSSKSWGPLILGYASRRVHYRSFTRRGLSFSVLTPLSRSRPTTWPRRL